jgi:hypothetical protein
LEAFKKQYSKLLNDLMPTKARIILFSPLPFEQASQLPDPAERNRALGRYCDAIKDLAAARGLQFADLFHATRATAAPLTDNGMHLTDEGYRLTTAALEGSLGLEPTPVKWDEWEQLRKAIVEKNRLFFYRWRPQNETYLFGFRKHEQGKNAKEVAEFDPLIAEKEKEIAKLRAGRSH